MLRYFKNIFKFRKRKKTGISEELYRLLQMNKRVTTLRK